MVWPAITVAGPTFVTARFARGLAAVTAVEPLLPRSGSVTALETLAVLEMMPDDEVAVPVTREMVALPPAARVPRLHEIDEVPEQLPCVGVADTNDKLPTRVSFTVTRVDGLGPLLVTTIV